MDFTRQTNHTASSEPSKSRKSSWIKSMRMASIVLLFSATALTVAILCAFTFGKKGVRESAYVDTSKYQAVFMNVGGGQVYFGKIVALNKDYLTLQDVYYLTIKQEVQPNSNKTKQVPNLTPLGCEIHRPQNEMVINRDQVLFWENLQDESAEGSVPGAIKKFKAANPNGLQCNTPTQTN